MHGELDKWKEGAGQQLARHGGPGPGWRWSVVGVARLDSGELGVPSTEMAESAGAAAAIGCKWLSWIVLR